MHSRDLGFEAHFYRALNHFVEPLVRVGFGSPGLFPAGAIVVETKGRKTGRIFNVPLLATVVGNLVVISTVRRRSQWLKNLAQNPDVRYWMWGRAHEATAFVFAPDLEAPRPNDMPHLARYLAAALLPISSLWGIAFAILSPADRNPGSSPPPIAQPLERTAAATREPIG